MKQGEIWLVALDLSFGSEIQKTRPCMVVSPAELHDYVRTVIIAPMTTGGWPAPFRTPIAFQGKRGFVLLDQIRAVDKARLVKRLGASGKALGLALTVLQEMFAVTTT